MMDEDRLRQIIEGLLLAAGKPLSLEQISNIFTEEERPENETLRSVLDEIESGCEGRGFELKKVASGYRFQVRQSVGEWVGRLWDEKPQKYSRALMETLAIVAYRQPLTRGDIEKVRGVAVSTTIMRTLLEREWVRVVGHRDVPGRPAMYATTRQFLDYFNLASLDQLPPLSDIRDMEDVNKELSLEEPEVTSRVLELPDEEREEQEGHEGHEGHENREEQSIEEGEMTQAANEDVIERATRPLEEILAGGRLDFETVDNESSAENEDTGDNEGSAENEDAGETDEAAVSGNGNNDASSETDDDKQGRN